MSFTIQNETAETRHTFFFGFIKSLAISALVFFGMMLVWRLFFFTTFKDESVSEIPFSEIMEGFMLGFRYDSATIAYILIIPLLLAIGQFGFSMVKLQRGTVRFTRIWMVVFFTAAVLSFISDYHFFIFFHDHLNVLIFKFFEDDTTALVHTITKSYPLGFYAVLLIGSVFAGIKVMQKIFPYDYNLSITSSVWLRRSIPIGVFLVWGIMARASFGLFPINLGDAAYSTHFLLNKLGPNPLFSFEKAIETKLKSGKEIPFWTRHEFADNIKSAISLAGESFVQDNNEISDFDEFDAVRHKPSQKISVEKNPHVVLGIMEGMGAWVLDHDSENFRIAGDFRAWMEKGIYFDRFVSTGNRSIESLQSILLSIPSIPGDAPLSQTKYGTKQISTSLAPIFNNRGYETHFVYGGKLSWQRLLDFLNNQGFEYLHGDGNFDPDAIRTDWGVYDEELFDYVLNLLKNADKPYFIVFMTTTNHPPFTIPDSYDPAPLKIPEEITSVIQDDMDQVKSRFQTYQYGNQMLAEFLDELYGSELGNATVTAITGDHNFGGVRYYPEEEMLDFLRVPLYIKFENDNRLTPKIISTFGSHVDIGPTLLHAIGFDEPFLGFGRNLLDTVSPSYMVNEYGFIFSKEGVGRYNYLTREKGFYLWEDENMNRITPIDLDHPLYGELIQRMTAYYSAASYFLESEWNR